MDIRHNGRWHGLGAAGVLAPDTAESRNPDSGLPILLGQDGFFGRLGACPGHAGKTLQIGRAGGGTWRAGGRGRLRTRAPGPAHPRPYALVSIAITPASSDAPPGPAHPSPYVPCRALR